MCFYVKRHLDYKPYVTPSYVVTREQEAVKEKEREREKEAAAKRQARANVSGPPHTNENRPKRTINSESHHVSLKIFFV